MMMMMMMLSKMLAQRRIPWANTPTATVGLDVPDTTTEPGVSSMKLESSTPGTPKGSAF